MRLIVVIVLAVAALLVVFALLPQSVRDSFLPSQQSIFDKGVQQFGSQHDADYLTFTDPDSHFSVKYPLGYIANFVNESEERFHAAAIVPGSAAMVFSVYVTNESQSLLDSPSGQAMNISRQGIMKVNGKDAQFVEGYLSDQVITDRMFLKEVAVPCGNYTLVAVGFIPTFLVQERITFDYMFTTLECPS